MRMYNLTLLADQSLQTVILCSHFLTVLTASPVKARQQVYQLDLGLWRSSRAGAGLGFHGRAVPMAKLVDTRQDAVSEKHKQVLISRQVNKTVTGEWGTHQSHPGFGALLKAALWLQERGRTPIT